MSSPGPFDNIVSFPFEGASVTREPPTLVYPPRPTIRVSVREPSIQIVALGGNVRFYCDAQSMSSRVSDFHIIWLYFT